MENDSLTVGGAYLKAEIPRLTHNFLLLTSRFYRKERKSKSFHLAKDFCIHCDVNKQHQIQSTETREPVLGFLLCYSLARCKIVYSWDQQVVVLYSSSALGMWPTFFAV